MPSAVTPKIVYVEWGWQTQIKYIPEFVYWRFHVSSSSAFSESGGSWFVYCWLLAWRILNIITLLACEMSAIVCSLNVELGGDRFFIFPLISWVLCQIKYWLHPENRDFSRELVEKAMAAHSSTLAWKIPWMEEPGRLQSMGSLRVRHEWATSL